MENNASNYSEIRSIEELRLQKGKLRKRVGMQEELLVANAGQIKNSFKVLSFAGNIFSGVSRYSTVLGLVYSAFRFYKKIKHKSLT